MLTKDVVFNGENYKIRNNMRTKMLYELELKSKGGEIGEIEAIATYAWCMLRGYNTNFNMSFDEFSMHMDDEANEAFLTGATEVIGASTEDLDDESKEEVADEKK